MIFYHGSKKLIQNPIYRGSQIHNDYGPAFYLTKDLTSAKVWACKQNELGVVNKYFIDDRRYKELKILDLTDKNKYSVLNWVAILMHHHELTSTFKKGRSNFLEWLDKFYIDVEQYDVIIGYRADDSYFRFPLSFVEGRLSFNDLEEIYLLGNLGTQYVFKSQRAIALLHFKEIIECDETFLGIYHSVVKEASNKARDIIDQPVDINKKYIIDLMRENYEG